MSSKKRLEIPKKPTNVNFKRALFAYEANEPDELSFKEGDLLYIIDWKTNQDWWTARLKDKKGIVPANYFSPILKDDGVNPFLDACRRGNVDSLEDCLAMRVPVNFQDVTGNTGLHYAAKGGHLNIIERLLSVPKIRISLNNREGDTPLHRSANAGKTEVCRRLLAHDNSIIEAENVEGQTPFDLAINPDTKAVFLEHIGHKINNHGYTLEDYKESESDDDENTKS